MGSSPAYPMDATWDDNRTVTNLEGHAVAQNAPNPFYCWRTLATWGRPNVGEFYMRYSATDYAGNQSAPVEAHVYIDNQVPVTTVATFGTLCWKLTATDPEAGIGSTHYSFDGAPYVVYTAADHAVGIVNTQPGAGVPGAHVLNYYSVDRLGNTEAIKTLNYNVP